MVGRVSSEARAEVEEYKFRIALFNEHKQVTDPEILKLR